MDITIRIIGVILLVLGLNAFYVEHGWREYLYHNADQFLQVEKVSNCDIVYVSESSNFSPDHVHDEDARKMSQFMADFYPSMQVEAINKPAAHANYYASLLNLIPSNADVQTVIVSVNLRSFGPDWIYSELDPALNKEMVMYNHRPAILNRFLIGLQAYPHPTLEDQEDTRNAIWDTPNLPFEPPRHTVNSWCALEKWGDWRDPKRQLADHFIKQYAFVIDDRNKRLEALDQIVEMANQRAWNLVFNILPENLRLADSLVGSELTQLMKQNVEFLLSRYSSQGVDVIDQSNLLGPEHFADRDFPTEHYDEAGRKMIATELAFYLRKFHTEHYQNPAWATNLNSL